MQELANREDLQMMNVHSLYTNIEKEVYSIYGSFTCFYSSTISSFVVEIPRRHSVPLLKLMTQSTIMHLMELAKRTPAQ